MKLITAFIDPASWIGVRKRLEIAGINEFALREGFRLDRKHRKSRVYRGAKYTVDHTARLEISFVLDDDEVTTMVSTIENAGGEGYITIGPIDEVVRMPPRAALKDFPRNPSGVPAAQCEPGLASARLLHSST